MHKQHRYAYDKSYRGHKAKKWVCPQCAKKRFVRFFDFEQEEYLPERFGKCDREDACGHVETPWDWLKQKGEEGAERTFVRASPLQPVEQVKLPEISKDTVRETLRAYVGNNLVVYLRRIIGQELTESVVAKYLIGTAKGNGTIFWQVDKFMRVRTAQKIFYNADTGKRRKDIVPPSVRLFTVEDGYEPCLFGEHLLWEKPHALVAVVESEKTAVICSAYFPQLDGRDVVWVATTGMHGGYTEWKLNALAGREVILCPDFSFAARATWGMVPMRKRLVSNSNGKLVSKIMEDGELDEEHESYADKLRRRGAFVRFWRGFEEVRDGSDLADYVVEEKPKKFIAAPDLSSLAIFDKCVEEGVEGVECEIQEESEEIWGEGMATGVSLSPNTIRAHINQEIARLIYEKYGYGVSIGVFDAKYKGIEGQMSILANPLVQELISRFNLQTELKY